MVRFANYKYHGRNINNLGDHVQIMTIDYLYAEMGIDLSEIVYIDVNELSVYDGQMCIRDRAMGRFVKKAKIECARYCKVA